MCYITNYVLVVMSRYIYEVKYQVKLLTMQSDNGISEYTSPLILQLRRISGNSMGFADVAVASSVPI